MSIEQEVSGEQIAEAAAPVEAEQMETHQSEGIQGNHVPLEALQAERAQRQQLQEELRVIKDHIALMQANQPKQQQAAEDDGLSEDDVLTVRDLKRILSKKESEYQTSLKELKISQKYPDYEQVVTQYLPDVIKQNPWLRENLRQTQDYEMAYYLAKNSEAYKSSQKKTKQNADAQRIVQNATQVGSLSSMGSTSPVNQAKRYRDMADDDFRKLVNKNMGHF